MTQNPELDLAWKFLQQTGTNIFLTGKAGTGKTTFLKELRQKSPKRMIVVAPTGVAAINAGGVTIHSFFQIPFGPYLPSMKRNDARQTKMNFNKEKINIIRTLDLLIIDEISMVRADLLDAINDVLQRYRDRNKPFGGVQLLMIGDLQQLAPVVKPDEWELMKYTYPSPYFFDSNTLKSTSYITVELRHIYRQSDTQFIDILNRVRDNNIDEKTLEKLNSRYIPNFEPPQEEGYITLTSHNHVAQAINERKLESLDAPAFNFNCEVEGNFPEYLFPNQSVLTLKKGAQVMFIKNDPSGQHRYFNGKIGRVTDVDQTEIFVTLDDPDFPIKVEMGEWTNAKYVIDNQTKEITESVEGVFRQFPIKTAWAITIHKSQGLTFDRAIIDAADSFSHGQVYVALSRCRSFEGLVLRTPLQCSSIINDATIKAFNKDIEENQPDQVVLSAQSRIYHQSLLIDMFDFEQLRMRLWGAHRVVSEHLGGVFPKLKERWDEVLRRFDAEVYAVSLTFHNQINSLIAGLQDLNDEALKERVAKGQNYFLDRCEQIIDGLVGLSRVEVDSKESRKLLADALKKLQEVLSIKLAVLGIDNKDGFCVHTYLDVRAKAAIEGVKAGRAAGGAAGGGVQGGLSGGSGDRVEKVSVDDSLGDIADSELFEVLRRWRMEMAERDGVPAYVVMHQKALISVCGLLPRSVAELLRIKGIGKAFIAKYSGELLAVLEEFSQRRS